jgi:sugar transferase EpsL
MSTNFWTTAQWQEVEQGYLAHRQGMNFNLALKRALDLFLAIVLCLLLLPVLALIALGIRLTSPGPIFFRQERLGRLGENFQIYKFRSMVDGAIYQGAGLETFKGDPRVTPLGQFLREYHLDELPQLFNVLWGDMSLVGPRPLLPSALATYSEVERRRLLVLPGMTGWQQINGGELNEADENVRLDLWYVDHYTVGLDFSILFQTLPVVLRKEGVYGVDGWKRGRNKPSGGEQ